MTTEDARRFATVLHEQAPVHALDPLTAVAMLFHESRFNPRAVSPDGEDYGLAQIRARHVGECANDKNPALPDAGVPGTETASARAGGNIRVMAELITMHRQICRAQVGTPTLPRWLASRQGATACAQRWCIPATMT